MRVQLKEHQKVAVKWIQEHGYQCMLCDDMGLGKTATALSGIAEWLDMGRYLIVCPASLKLNWCHEIKMWLNIDTVPDNMTDYPIAVTNYERLGAYKDIIKEQNFIGAIFDESHYLKNPNSTRTKLAIELCRYIAFVMLLSGTPMVSGPADLAPQLDVLRLLPDFGGYMKFYRRYCNPVQTPYGWDFTGASHIAELHKKLKKFMIRRTKEECGINLPPKQIIDIPVTNCIQPYAHTLQDMELQQQVVNDVKYPYAVDFINNLLLSGKRPVVFVHHKNLMKDLMDKYGNIAVNIYGGQTAEERECAVRRFQNEEVALIFCSLQASATGITLTSSDTAVFLEYLWSPSISKQAQDRIHRISQTRPVTIYNLYCPGSIESQKEIRSYIKELDMEGVL